MKIPNINNNTLTSGKIQTKSLYQINSFNTCLIHFFQHIKMPVPSWEYDSCFLFVGCVWAVDHAIWLGTFRFEFSSEFSIFVILHFSVFCCFVLKLFTYCWCASLKQFLTFGQWYTAVAFICDKFFQLQIIFIVCI